MAKPGSLPAEALNSQSTRNGARAINKASAPNPNSRMAVSRRSRRRNRASMNSAWRACRREIYTARCFCKVVPSGGDSPNKTFFGSKVANNVELRLFAMSRRVSNSTPSVAASRWAPTRCSALFNWRQASAPDDQASAGNNLSISLCSFSSTLGFSPCSVFSTLALQALQSASSVSHWWAIISFLFSVFGFTHNPAIGSLMICPPKPGPARNNHDARRHQSHDQTTEESARVQA